MNLIGNDSSIYEKHRRRTGGPYEIRGSALLGREPEVDEPDVLAGKGEGKEEKGQHRSSFALLVAGSTAHSVKTIGVSRNCQ